MSILLVGQVLHMDMPPVRKLTLLALANYAKPNGYCYPSQKTLSADVGITTRALRDHLHALANDGWLTVIPGRGYNRPSRYVLNVEAIKEASDAAHTARSEERDAEDCDMEAEESSAKPARKNRKLTTREAEVDDREAEVDDKRTGSVLPPNRNDPSRTVSDPSFVRTRARRGPQPLTDEQRQRIIQDHPHIPDVSAEIDAALNHTASLKCKDTNLYVRTWLRRWTPPWQPRSVPAKANRWANVMVAAGSENARAPEYYEFGDEAE